MQDEQALRADSNSQHSKTVTPGLLQQSLHKQWPLVYSNSNTQRLDKDGLGVTFVNLDLQQSLRKQWHLVCCQLGPGTQPNHGGNASTPGQLQQHY